MGYETINVILTVFGLIIALGGGISGFISLYILWKKSKARLKVVTTKANYFLDKKNLIVHAILNLKNEKDNPVYITDLVSSIRFDAKKKKKGTPLGFSVSPLLPIDFPINIPRNSSKAVNLKFVFPNIEINSIDRIGEAKFIGIYNKTPVLVSDERDFQTKWSELPLLLRLDLHINGSESLHTITGVYKIDKVELLSGTFNSVDIGKIQHNFMKNGK